MLESLQVHFTDNLVEAGLDEAGRGCLAGPVVAAAVILPRGFSSSLFRDSKQLNESQRLEAAQLVKEVALDYHIALASAEEIDQINILQASILAMHRSVQGLKALPEMLLVDGNRFNPFPWVPHQCIIKGDSKFQSIAAASILAKTYRDELMSNLAKEHPQYAWHRNMGYPTKAHRNAIFETGITQHHRKTFRLLAEDMGGNS